MVVTHGQLRNGVKYQHKVQLLTPSQPQRVVVRNKMSALMDWQMRKNSSLLLIRTSLQLLVLIPIRLSSTRYGQTLLMTTTTISVALTGMQSRLLSLNDINVSTTHRVTHQTMITITSVMTPHTRQLQMLRISIRIIHWTNTRNTTSTILVFVHKTLS